MEVFKIKYKLFLLLLTNLALTFNGSLPQFKDMKDPLIFDRKIESNLPDFKVDVPTESRPVTNLPWTQDKDFLRALEKNNSKVLIGGFCTVFNTSLPGEQHNVHLAASNLSGTVVDPEETFSQNLLLGPYTQEKGYKDGLSYVGSQLVPTIGGGVCKIASTLYNVAILGDLEIVERHNHSMPVNYVPYGQDATVAYGVKDFKFKNNKDFPILIWAKAIENRLYIGFYGREKPPRIQWEHKISNQVEAPKHFRENPNLKKGEEKVIFQGMDGALVESWIIITDENGESRTKSLGTSYYNPRPHVVEINPK